MVKDGDDIHGCTAEQTPADVSVLRITAVKNEIFLYKDNNLLVINSYLWQNLFLMLYSMTGFGKTVNENSRRKITVEIKTLNSKQVDLSLRLAPFYRPVELDVRNRVSVALQRGKVEMSVGFECLCGEVSGCSHINGDAIASYKMQFERIAEKNGFSVPDNWFELALHLPNVISSENDSRPLNDTDVEGLNEAIDDALARVAEYRRAEGEKLEKFFTEKIDAIRGLLKEVAPFEEERVTKIRARIEENLNNLKGITVDKSRLEQEMIFYIEKLDINEEKQRLTQHLDYFIETMKGPEGQGKKLAFIAQEMGREINTLGSKSNQADMQRIVVMMKDHLEQIKEQVLNVL